MFTPIGAIALNPMIQAQSFICNTINFPIKFKDIFVLKLIIIEKNQYYRVFKFNWET